MVTFHSYHFQEPVVKTSYKQSCILLCFETESLDMTARIPVSGYTPGQTINAEFTADIKVTNGMKELWAGLVRVRC